MNQIYPRQLNPLLATLIREPLVISLILLNTIVLFLDEFPAINIMAGSWLMAIDNACIIYFVIEAALKIWSLSFRAYWLSHFNKFDFLIVMLSLPSLILPLISNVDAHVFAIFLVLRLGRLLRFFRVLRFIPNANHIFAGVLRSLKASVGVFIILLILNLAFALGATMLFGDIAPEFFGDPLIATYSLFKVFTIEGWFEIPDSMTQRGLSAGMVLLVRGYFVVAVSIGGILGLSLANAIFVDEMTSDNTQKVENMVADLQVQLTRSREESVELQQDAWERIQSEISEIRQLMESLRPPESDRDGQ